MENRTFNHDILNLIQTRWSPRAFDPERPVAREVLLSLLEAARFAPSCSNEQPWRFLLADRKPNYEKLFGVLTERNQAWTKNAPVLMLILAEKQFVKRGEENHWHQFDTGTAWGYISLEAERRGLVTHCMAGFDAESARAVFDIPGNLSIIAAVAIGYYGDPAELPEALQAREHPNVRKPITELLYPLD